MSRSRFTPLAMTLMGCALWAVGPEAWAAETANRMVAIVNDAVITLGDVTSRLNAMLEDRERPLPEDTSPEEVSAAILGRLIETKLMLQEAKRLEVRVDAVALERNLRRFKEQFGSDDEFQAFLLQAGLTEGHVRRRLEEQLMVETLIEQKVRSTIAVSPQEVAESLQLPPDLPEGEAAVRLATILIRVNHQRSDEDASQHIASLHEELEGGADFAELAKRHSEGPNAEEGGALEWMTLSELLPELESAARELKLGQHSTPIRTALGYHLIRIVDRRTAEDEAFMAARRRGRQHIYRQKFQQAFLAWMRELKRQAYIEILSAP